MNILTASPNTSFAAHSVRPNAFGTSQSPRTLGERAKRKQTKKEV